MNKLAVHTTSLVVALAWMVGCGPTGSGDDEQTDSGVQIHDGAAPDSGSTPDAGAGDDAGGGSDAGSPDYEACSFGSEWAACTDLPPLEYWDPNNDDVFDPSLLTTADPPLLTYIAATSLNPIPWTIQIGEGALIRVFLPPGVGRLYMGINAPCFAASQAARYYTYGEFPCDAAAPDSPTFGAGPGAWLSDWGYIIEGGGFTPHDRQPEYAGTESCLFIGFFNEDNLYQTGVELQGVGFTYEISDRAAFEAWAGQ